MRVVPWLAVLWLLILSAWVRPVQAEPYLAVQQGMKCNACHVNPSGGGMRNEYGNIYAQTQLTVSQLAAADAQRWTGRINDFVAAGGNLRASARQVDVPNNDSEMLFELDEARLYLQFSPLPGRVDVYLDQRVAPGGSRNLEAYGRYSSADRRWYLKAGQMFLPYGLRLENDAAFIRSVPGINFTTPDTGVEVGWELQRWSMQFAVSNGSAGGPETDTGKQASLRVEHVRPGWRLGASANINDTDAGTRHMQNIFAGLRTGKIAWLAEIDHVRDETFAAGVLTQRIALLEANWNVRRGHNLKFTAEYLEPDVDRIIGNNHEQNRYGVFWEYFPFEFTQLRAGVRLYDGDPEVDFHNRDTVVLQLHGYF